MSERESKGGPTPGPWASRRANQPDNVGGFDYAILSPDGLILGEAYERVGRSVSFPAEANARLIAAAPLLLEACRKVAATYGAECPDLENLTDADGERFGAMLHVVNAIAKAESGEDEES